MIGPKVWAVVISNYEPREVLALYDNEAAAIEHADDDRDCQDLRVVAWSVRSEYRPCEHPTPINITIMGEPTGHMFCESCGADWWMLDSNPSYPA